MKIEYRRPTKLDSPESNVDPSRRFLVEGDSWFSMGSFPPKATYPNLLSAIKLSDDVQYVNLAKPGAVMVRMAKRREEDPFFEPLLGPKEKRYWGAVFLSGGGNDLIDLLGVSPKDENGQPRPAKDRLLWTGEEAGPVGSLDRYISGKGWEEFSRYLHEHYKIVAAIRDSGRSSSRPIVAHTYSTPTARDAGSRGGKGGWLYPKLVTYGIPAADRQPLTELIFGMLRTLLLSFDSDSNSDRAIPRLHVFDSAAIPLIKAPPGSVGDKGDWINEIHLNAKGYRKIGRKMGPWFEDLLKTRYS
ncbi:MAG: hypothetical protein ACK5O3_10075 [Burkholderiales bacterium]|jgi:hypothetical protein